MDFVIDFIVDNYIWFAIGFVAIFMIIIGFIAEKTDFGRKPFKSDKKEKTVPVEEQPTESGGVEEVPQISDVASLSEPEVPSIESNVEVEQPTVIDATQEPIESDITTPELETDNFDSTEEDLEVPFGDQEVSEPTINEDVVVPETEEESSEDDVWKF